MQGMNTATVEAARTAALVGGATPASVVTVPGALHPVTEHWCPLPPGVPPARRLTRREL